jgi:uncharacterized protein (TIGR03118 family)
MFRQQQNLRSDVLNGAKFNDPNLLNPWGVATKDNSTYWIANNGTNLVNLYNKDGSWTGTQNITVAGGKPTGLVSIKSTVLVNAKPTGLISIKPTGLVKPTHFQLNGSTASFITATENGTIDAWNASTGATTVSVFTASNTVYTGLTILRNTLYVANFSRGTVDVFDSSFNYVSSFTDTDLVTVGYAPYNVLAQGGKIYVTFAKQNATKSDVLNGEGNGYVDVFDVNGVFLKRVINRGYLNSPWGMLVGELCICGSQVQVLYVGNFGDGSIQIYNRKTGVLIDTVKDKFCNDISIDGLRELFVIDTTVTKCPVVNNCPVVINFPVINCPPANNNCPVANYYFNDNNSCNNDNNNNCNNNNNNNNCNNNNNNCNNNNNNCNNNNNNNNCNNNNNNCNNNNNNNNNCNNNNNNNCNNNNNNCNNKNKNHCQKKKAKHSTLNTDNIYFTAGINDEADGLFGLLIKTDKFSCKNC